MFVANTGPALPLYYVSGHYHNHITMTCLY